MAPETNYQGVVNYTIRPATAADVHALIALRQVMFDAMGIDGDDSWRAGCAGFLRQGFDSGDVAAFVGDAGGTVVGGGVGLIHRRLPAPGNLAGLHGYIMSMATEPSWRGRGVAGGVLDALLDWFAANEVASIELHATAQGEPLYRARGFSDARYPALRR